jgi:16S rRNA (adenine1518-N6/adenine1519-N6)-dimethyltransferase
MFQTQREVRELLAETGLRPRKRFGQHFLIDRNLMAKLIDAAEPSTGDAVLEVGVGTGSLTSQLAERAGQVLAFEIDEKLAEVARRGLAGHPNVRLVVGDALETKSRLAPALVSSMAESAAAGLRLKLVANLPYDIATPLVLNLLVSELQIERLCFTVQKEVAERFLARCGDEAYGIASILAAVLTTPRRIAAVPKEAFWPRPNVESVMIRLDARPDGRRGVGDAAGFGAMLRGFFQHRRKTLGRIAAGDAKLEAALAATGVPRDRRPESVSPGEWLRVWHAARATAASGPMTEGAGR